MSSTAATKPRISLDLLARMLERLTPEELARFPARKLPDQIPLDWLRSLNPEQLARVRAILAERQPETSAQPADADPTDIEQPLLDAMRQTDAKRLPAALRILQRDVSDLADLIHRWRNNLQAAVEVRDLPSSTSLEVASQAPAQHPRKDPQPPMERKRHEITRLLQGLQADFVGLFQAEWVLRARIEAGADRDGRLADALQNLRVTIAPLEELLARFQTLSLTIAHHEMADVLQRLQFAQTERAALERELEQLRARDRRGGNWLRSGAGKDESGRLQSTILALTQQAGHNEVVLRREQVLRWLDSYVDASLDPLTERMARRRLQEAGEMLVRLIREFCNQLEQRARDYSGRVAPAGPMQLLRAYFAGKAKAPTLNCAAAEVEISTRLMRLERDLGTAILSR